MTRIAHSTEFSRILLFIEARSDQKLELVLANFLARGPVAVWDVLAWVPAGSASASGKVQRVDFGNARARVRILQSLRPEEQSVYMTLGDKETLNHVLVQTSSNKTQQQLQCGS